MKLGENICKLRKDKGFTQEQLANCVSVSIAAVSKWETNSAYPDIELLPKIAQVFDVSIDYLMGYQLESDMTIDDHIKFADTLVYNRQAKEAIEYFNAIAVRYPNNNKVRINMARYMIYGTYGSNATDYKKQLLNDAESILLSVNDTQLTRDEYDFKYSYLCILYKTDKKFDTALDALKKIKHKNYINCDETEAEIYNSLGLKDTAVRFIQRKLLNGIKNSLGGFYTILYDSPEKVLLYNELELKILLQATSDIPSVLDQVISNTYETGAYMQARLGNKEKALEMFEKAVRYAVRCETNSYSAIPYFDMLEDDESARCNQKNAILNAVKSNERIEYDLISDEPRFIELMETLKR